VLGDPGAQGLWEPVAGYEGLYEISDRGQVRSLDRRGRGARSGHLIRGHVLKDGKVVNGHPSVSLRKDGKNKNVYVDYLVLEMFGSREARDARARKDAGHDRPSDAQCWPGPTRAIRTSKSAR
jgi:hypothetical protein